MGKRLLLRTQKNDIHDRIVVFELNPSDFEFHNIKSRLVSNCLVSKIVHKPTDYYFTFDFDNQWPDKRRIEYFPTEDGKVKGDSTYEWEYIIYRVEDWLDVIKTETTAPDLWAMIADEKRLFEIASTSDLSNDLFNQAQQNYISEQLRIIKEHLLKTPELTIEQTNYLEDRFNYLYDTLHRVGRKDWINLVMGAFVYIVMYLALPPEARKDILGLLYNVISWILGGGVLLR